MTHRVAIVILNWNGQKFLEKFLPSVIKHSAYEGVAVYIADNGSTDDSLGFLAKNFPEINTISFPENHGFTGGYNRALAQIDAKYYVLLNSDVEVTPNWILPIANYLDKNPDVAACMPKIKAYNNQTKFEYAGASGGFIDKFGFPFCRGRILSEIEEDKAQYDKTIDIFWATGACLFVRADLFKKVGGLDDSFFAHMEEIDLCWRLKNIGFRIVCYSDTEVFHVGGGTLPNNNPHKLFLNYRNNLLLLYKNLPSRQLFFVLLFRMLLDGASALAYLFRGSFGFFASVLRAHFAFYRFIPKFRHKRRKIKALSQKIKHSEIYDGSIIFDFFMRGKKHFSQLIFKTETKTKKQ